MRVAFLSQPWDQAWMPPSESVSIVTHEMGRRLASRPEVRDVVVYARGWHGRDPEQHDGMTYRYVPEVAFGAALTQGRPELFASPVYHLDYVLQVARDLRTRPCDLVVVHNFSQFVPFLRRANPRARIVLYMHCDWLAVLGARRARRRVEAADAVLGVSDWLTAAHARALPRFAGRFATVHPGVDNVVFAPASRPSDSRPARLCYVGRLSPEKGLHVLVDAFVKIAEQRPDVELDLVGAESVVLEEMLVGLSRDPCVRALRRFYPGGYLESLRSRLPAAAAARVTVRGWLPREEVAARLREAALCVNPSLYETFGMGVVEAMACGVPVVATRVGGMLDTVVDGHTGLLVERNDVDSLAGAILRLLDDDPLRRSMGAAARRRAVESFSWDQAVEALLDAFERGRVAPPAGRRRGHARADLTGGEWAR